MRNTYATVMISLALLLTGLVAIAGCRKQPTPPAPSKDAVTTKEVPASAGSPFRDAAGKTATIIADAAREQPSLISAESLGRLHISGIVLLFTALAARFLFGSWKDAYIASGLGIIPSVLAVLLSEYSRVVLIIPFCGVAILSFIVYRRISEWRTKAKGFDATATVIEKADTGQKSLGQLMKDRIAETGLSDIVDKALKPLEALWANK